MARILLTLPLNVYEGYGSPEFGGTEEELEIEVYTSSKEDAVAALKSALTSLVEKELESKFP